MPQTAQTRFWQQTRRLTAGLLLLWLVVSLAIAWFARDLHAWAAFGFPLSYWLASEGALLFYLLLVIVYVVVMDRLESRLLDEQALDEQRPGAL